MAATRDDIRFWYEQGLKEKATHMVVVCDTYDWEDFPVYVKPTEKVTDVVAKYSRPNDLHKVMEVYDLSKDKEEQLGAVNRVFNY